MAAASSAQLDHADQGDRRRPKRRPHVGIGGPQVRRHREERTRCGLRQTLACENGILRDRSIRLLQPRQSRDLRACAEHPSQDRRPRTPGKCVGGCHSTMQRRVISVTQRLRSARGSLTQSSAPIPRVFASFAQQLRVHCSERPCHNGMAPWPLPLNCLRHL